MNDEKRPAASKSIKAIVIALLIAATIAVAGSHQGLRYAGIPVFALIAILAFAIQWLVFIPAYLSQSERYYDLTGSLTYLSVVALAASVKGDPRSLLLAALIGVWAVRLGYFLFLRIRDAGSDRRFDQIKPYFFRFLMTWTLQGLWVLITAGASLAAMTSTDSTAIGPVAVIGLLLWIGGFSIEVIADRQKRAFRRDPDNAERFIRHGLWAWSRHPNYFGEIMLWLGVAIIALPALSGWQYATLISPLFVYLLLSRVSGIPALEAHAEKRWGEDPAYRAYREATPVLFMRPPKNHS
jgi:steroid 5-alpha reductase family enzyme